MEAEETEMSSSSSIKRHQEKEKTWQYYWITISAFTTLEIALDFLLYWIPFYYELKLLFVLWMCLPFSQGSTLIWTMYLHPLLEQHEASIDRQLELYETLALNFISSKGENLKKWLVNLVLENLSNEKKKKMLDRATSPLPSPSNEIDDNENNPESQDQTNDSPNTAERRKARRDKKEKRKDISFTANLLPTKHKRSPSTPVPEPPEAINNCHFRKGSLGYFQSKSSSK